MSTLAHLPKEWVCVDQARICMNPLWSPSAEGVQQPLYQQMAGRLWRTSSKSLVQNWAKAASSPSKLTRAVKLKATPGISNSVQMHCPNVHNLLNSNLITSLEACPGKCSLTSHITAQSEARSSTATTKALPVCLLHLGGLVGVRLPWLHLQSSTLWH